MKSYVLVWIAASFLCMPRQGIATCPDTLDIFLGNAQKLLRSREVKASEKERFIYHMIDQAQVYRANNCQTGAGRVLLLVGLYQDISQQPDSAYVHYIRGISMLEEAMGQKGLDFRRLDSLQLAILYLNASRILQQKWEYAATLELLQKSLNLRKVISGNPGLGTVYRSMGVVHSNMDQPAKALSYHRLSVKAFLAENKDRQRDIASVYNNMCISFGLLKQIDSVEVYTQAIREMVEVYEFESLYNAYFNLGQAYMNLDSFAKARHIHQGGLIYLDTSTTDKEKSTPFSQRGVVNGNNSIGLSFLRDGEPNMALPYFEKARSLLTDAIPSQLKKSLYLNLATTHGQLMQPDSASVYYRLAYESLEKTNAQINSSVAGQTDFMLKNAESHLQIVENDRQIAEQRQFILMLISGLLLTVIVVGILLFVQRLQQAKHKAELSQTIHNAESRVGDAIVTIYREEQKHVTRERNHLGKILHENIQGQISISKMLVQNIEDALASVNDSVRDHLQIIKSNLESSNEHVRRISHQLKDGKSYQETYKGKLLEDVEKVIQPYRATGLFHAISFESDLQAQTLDMQDLYISNDLKNDILYWVQGALTNVVKHSKADQVSIRLGRKEDSLFLTIHDNGRGIAGDWDTPETQGSGLMSIREEVEAYHGRFHIGNDQGTCLSIIVPLPRM